MVYVDHVLHPFVLVSIVTLVGEPVLVRAIVAPASSAVKHTHVNIVGRTLVLHTYTSFISFHTILFNHVR
jgi:hypothetical protein